MADSKQFKNDPNNPRKFRRKHMWWRYLLVFLGGFLFAGVGTLSGVAIASATTPASTVTEALPPEVKNLLAFVDSEDTILTNIMKYITGERDVNYILDNIELRFIISEKMVGAKIYKKINFYPDSEAVADEYGYNTDFDGWAPVTLNMLINGNIQVPGEAQPRTFVDNLMKNLVISDVMDVSGTPLESMGETPISDVAQKLPNTKIGELFPDAEGVVGAVKDLTLNELASEEALNKIYVKDLMNVQKPTGEPGEKREPFMDAMCFNKKGTTPDLITQLDYDNPRTVAQFKDLDTLFSELVIDDFVTITKDPSSPDYDKLLAHISGTPVKDLADKISHLTVKDVIDFDKLEDGMPKRVLIYLQDVEVDKIGTEFEKVPLTVALADEIFEDPETKTTVKGVWKMLLYEDLATGTQHYDTYTIKSFGDLINNMTHNMSTCSINTFVECGLIEVSSETLNADIIVGINEDGFTPIYQKLGDMKINDVLNFLANPVVVPVI